MAWAVAPSRTQDTPDLILWFAEVYIHFLHTLFNSTLYHPGSPRSFPVQIPHALHPVDLRCNISHVVANILQALLPPRISKFPLLLFHLALRRRHLDAALSLFSAAAAWQHAPFVGDSTTTTQAQSSVHHMSKASHSSPTKHCSLLILRSSQRLAFSCIGGSGRIHSLVSPGLAVS